MTENGIISEKIGKITGKSGKINEKADKIFLSLIKREINFFADETRF